MKNKKVEGLIFILLAYCLPFLLGGLIFYGKKRGLNISYLTQFQMLTPALAVITLLILTRRDQVLPRRPFYFYLVCSFIYLLASLGPVFIPSFPKSAIPQNFLFIAFSLGFLIAIFSTNKHLRKTYGLNLGNWKKIIGVTLLFFCLYVFRAFAITSYEEGMAKFFANFNINRLPLALALLVNFPFAFIFFFGEEYGWRFYLQPSFQKRFGMVWGTLLVGLCWGFWHLPLNLFYYSAEGMGFISLVNQLFICLSYGIFFSFAYNYSQSIWSVVLIHYINNHFILLFTDTWDLSVIENQVYTWPSTFINGALMLVLYGSFIFSKYCRDASYRQPSLDERKFEEIIDEKI